MFIILAAFCSCWPQRNQHPTQMTVTDAGVVDVDQGEARFYIVSRSRAR